MSLFFKFFYYLILKATQKIKILNALKNVEKFICKTD